VTAVAAAVTRYQVRPTPIEPAAWDAVVHAGAGSVFHTSGWLRALEEAGPGRFRPAHLVAEVDDRAVGVCPAFLFDACPRIDHLLTVARPEALQPAGPILLAHSLAALAGGPVVRPGHEAAALELALELERQAERLGAWAWGFANLGEGALLGWLTGRGYAVGRVSTAYALDVRWPDAAAYWSAMRRHRRKRLLAERRKSQRLGVRVGLGAAPFNASVALVHDFMARRSTPLDVLPRRFLRALDAHLADHEASVWAETPDGRLLAVFKGWRLGGLWSLWIAGLDEERTEAYEPYHGLMAELVETAIRHRVPRVDLGRSNGWIKRRYGALPRGLHLALQTRDAADAALLHRWCGGLERHHLATLDGSEFPTRCC
jgi:predicted N-acyltransferase